MQVVLLHLWPNTLFTLTHEREQLNTRHSRAVYFSVCLSPTLLSRRLFTQAQKQNFVSFKVRTQGSTCQKTKAKSFSSV